MDSGQWISNAISTGCCCSLCGSLLNKVVSDLPFCQHLCNIRALHCCSRACTGWRWTRYTASNFLPLPAAMMFVRTLFSDMGSMCSQEQMLSQFSCRISTTVLFPVSSELLMFCLLPHRILWQCAMPMTSVFFRISGEMWAKLCFRSKTRSRLTEPIPRPPLPLFLPSYVSADHWAPSHPLQMEAKWADSILAQLLSDDHDIWQFGSYLWAACGVNATGSNPIIMGLLSTKLCIGLFAAQGRYCHYSSFLCQEPLVSWQPVSG